MTAWAGMIYSRDRPNPIIHTTKKARSLLLNELAPGLFPQQSRIAEAWARCRGDSHFHRTELVSGVRSAFHPTRTGKHSYMALSVAALKETLISSALHGC